uniref:Uncharacterized protein n=1 Tax=Arundo donax TaxID=35708 RepID=A0A0A9EU50_ARUDO
MKLHFWYNNTWGKKGKIQCAQHYVSSIILFT